MSKLISNLHYQPPSPPQLVRRAQLLKELGISKSTLHARLDRNGRYYDETFPRPFFAPKSRIPYWHMADIHAWIVQARNRSEAVALHRTVSDTIGQPNENLSQDERQLMTQQRQQDAIAEHLSSPGPDLQHSLRQPLIQIVEDPLPSTTAPDGDTPPEHTHHLAYLRRFHGNKA